MIPIKDKYNLGVNSIKIDRTAILDAILEKHKIET